MNYENFEKRINSLRDIESFGQLEKQVQGQQRLTIKERKMKHDAIEKSKCAPINDKRFYFLTELNLYRFHIRIYQN